MNAAARGVLSTVCVFAALGSTLSARAVVGGRPIDVRAAPWTVVIRLSSSLQVHCTGVLTGRATVLTAAHCLYGRWGPRQPRRLLVTAGVSNYLDPARGDAGETRTVASYRIHPGYRLHGGVDDLAVLRLDRPFALGRDIRPVALPRAGMRYPGGVPTSIVGFGQQSGAVETPTGALVGVAATIQPQGVCGLPAFATVPANGIRLCVAGVRGTACFGDSGGPLVIHAPQPVVVGVLSEYAGDPCRSGNRQLYTYLGAPELRRFVAGDADPPAAPRLTSGAIHTHNRSPIRVGDTVWCRVPWLRSATRVRFVFQTLLGQVLQSSGSPAYVVGARAAGHQLACRVWAANAGGTAVAEQVLAPVARALGR